MPRTHRLRTRNVPDAQTSRSLLTDGLIVAAATAALYLLTFTYEYGYCAHFGIPGFLIEPSTGTILFSALFLSLAGVMLVEMSHLPRLLLSAIPWPRLRWRLVLVAVMWGIPGLMGSRFHWLAVLNLVTWTLLILSDYIYALAFSKGSISERMSQGEKDIDSTRSAWDGPTRVLGAKLVGFLLLFYFALTTAWAGGAIHARFQQGFVVLKSSPDVAVVKRYGDRLIAVRFAGQPARATGEFMVLDKKDLEFVNMDKLEKIGRAHV